MHWVFSLLELDGLGWRVDKIQWEGCWQLALLSIVWWLTIFCMETSNHVDDAHGTVQRPNMSLFQVQSHILQWAYLWISPNRNPGFLLQEPHHITDFIRHFIPTSKFLICLPRHIHQIHQIEWTPSIVPSLLTLWDLHTHGPGMLVFSSTHVMHSPSHH